MQENHLHIAGHPNAGYPNACWAKVNKAPQRQVLGDISNTIECSPMLGTPGCDAKKRACSVSAFHTPARRAKLDFDVLEDKTGSTGSSRPSHSPPQHLPKSRSGILPPSGSIDVEEFVPEVQLFADPKCMYFEDCQWPEERFEDPDGFGPPDALAEQIIRDYQRLHLQADELDARAWGYSMQDSQAPTPLPIDATMLEEPLLRHSDSRSMLDGPSCS
mmetsp:Transcript_52858/g.123693  ORF Transcript_52858/g.123693 Transcript_52858/m.123693 type:complete len:217 (-) Transcript_52858:39-689(-)